MLLSVQWHRSGLIRADVKVAFKQAASGWPESNLPEMHQGFFIYNLRQVHSIDKFLFQVLDEVPEILFLLIFLPDHGIVLSL